MRHEELVTLLERQRVALERDADRADLQPELALRGPELQHPAVLTPVGPDVVRRVGHVRGSRRDGNGGERITRQGGSHRGEREPDQSVGGTGAVLQGDAREPFLGDRDEVGRVADHAPRVRDPMDAVDLLGPQAVPVGPPVTVVDARFDPRREHRVRQDPPATPIGDVATGEDQPGVRGQVEHVRHDRAVGREAHDAGGRPQRMADLDGTVGVHGLVAGGEVDPGSVGDGSQGRGHAERLDRPAPPGAGRCACR